jgi:hypothetical protein
MAGVTLNDRNLAANVRTTSLNLILKYLNGEDEKYKKDLLLRLAGTVLPRLTEHTGEDGQPIIVQLSQSIAEKNGITPFTGDISERQTPIQSN